MNTLIFLALAASAPPPQNVLAARPPQNVLAAPVPGYSYDRAANQALAENRPLVIYVGQPKPVVDWYSWYVDPVVISLKDFPDAEPPCVVVSAPWKFSDGERALARLKDLPGTPQPVEVVAVIRKWRLGKKADAAPAKTRSAPDPAAPGTHSHYCPHCGTTWSHGDDMFGNRAAHMCPNCGRGPHWNPVSRSAPAAPAPAYYRPTISFGRAFGNCPGGT